MEHQPESAMDPVTQRGTQHQELSQHPVQDKLKCLNTKHLRKSFLKLRDLINKLEAKKGIVNYFLDCKRENLIPKQFSQNRAEHPKLSTNLQSQWGDIEKSTSIKFLKLSIEDAKIKVLELEKLFNEETQKFLDSVDVKYWADLIQYLDSISEKTQYKKHLQNQKKLQWLRSSRTSISLSQCNEPKHEASTTTNPTKTEGFKKKLSFKGLKEKRNKKPSLCSKTFLPENLMKAQVTLFKREALLCHCQELSTKQRFTVQLRGLRENVNGRPIGQMKIKTTLTLHHCFQK